MSDLESVFDPMPAQWRFMQSPAFIRGYGGAMGGGKSRALCEVVFDYMLDHPGLQAVMFRQEHTAIVKTTKKTMLEEVVPKELLAAGHQKASAGEDYIRLPNGSVCHFAGLDDPYRWYSAELGVVAFDEAQEISEEAVLRLITRLRQRGAPHKVLLGFNPSNPNHWLRQWFILGSSQTDYGFRKDHLVVGDADASIGDSEFVFSKATDNPHLPDSYIATLKGQPSHLRRRYLEGIWEFTEGQCYFDLEALSDYFDQLEKPILVGHTAGALDKPVRFERHDQGKWLVWKSPVRERDDTEEESGDDYVEGRRLPAHRYLIAVDTSSGASADYSGIQVVDVETFSQVAEYQDRKDPDLVAQEVYRAARIYNNALVVPEVTGGYGQSIVNELERLRVQAKKPVRIYTRKVLDRLSKKWTDRLGWDTQANTRFLMLDTLERVIREREFGLKSERAWTELTTFVRDEKGRPAAQPGMADDLVISLAIAAFIREQQPKQLQQVKPVEHRPLSCITGY